MPPTDLANILSRAMDVHNGFDTAETSAGKSAPHKAGGKTVSKASPAKKRTWKKPKDKPKRPLSAYNLFFKEERGKIMLEATQSSGDGDDKSKQRGETRSHRKTHGMGFAGLAKNIAAKWKNLDDEARSPFDSLASIDKARYRREVDEWKRRETTKKQQEKSAGQQDAEHDSAPVESLAPTSAPLSVPSAAPAPASADGKDHSMAPIPKSINLNGHSMLPQNFAHYKLPTVQSTLEPPNLKSTCMIVPTGQQHQPRTSLMNMLTSFEPTSFDVMIASSNHFDKTAPMLAAALFNGSSQAQCHPPSAPPPSFSSAEDRAWGNLESMLDGALDVSALPGGGVLEPNTSAPPAAAAGIPDECGSCSVSAARKSSHAPPQLPSSLELSNFEETLDTDLKDFLDKF